MDFGFNNLKSVFLNHSPGTLTIKDLIAYFNPPEADKG